MHLELLTKLLQTLTKLDRIDQVLKSGGAEVEQIAPKIIRGAIEEIYKTPFRLLGNLGKKRFQKIKRKIFNQLPNCL